MKNRIVTVSREFGSGGRTIARKAADLIGIPCYDQEIITNLARESKFTEDFVSAEIENVHSTWFAGFTTGIPTPSDTIWVAQCKVIKELAEKGSCIIVGRCADYILRGLHDCLNVFIHADYDFRAKRITEVYGENEVPTIRRLKEKDKSRAAYYLNYTDETWGLLRNYDVTLNSGVLGIDKCAEVIRSLY